MSDYACIYFKTRPGLDVPMLADELPFGAEIILSSQWAPEGATHEVDQYWRYYDIDARQGPWLLILKTLQLLLTSPDVVKVWYGSDHRQAVKECTSSRVAKIAEHYIKYGQTIDKEGS